MRHLQQFQRFRRHAGIVLLALAQTLAVSAFAQTTAAGTGNAAKGFNEGTYSLVDIGDFIGYQWFEAYQGTGGKPNKLDPSIYGGFRLTENLWRYVSLEQDFSYADNAAKLLPLGNNLYAQLPEHNYVASQLVDIYLTPRDAKLRPYVFGGAGMMWYEPSGINSITPPTSGPFVPPSYVGSTKTGALIYGAGIKYNWSRRVDFRFDVTGTVSHRAYYSLPTAPTGIGTVYVPSTNSESAIAVSVGVDFRLGLHEPPPPAAPAPPPPPPPPPPPTPVTVQPITGFRDVCAGDNLVLQTGASGGAPGSTITYQWSVNGQPAPGATGATFSLPTAGAPGVKTITVTASAGGQSATSGAVTVNVRPLLPPTITFAVNPSTVAYTAPPITLAANANAPNACNGNLTVRYTGEGVTGNSFNPGAVGGLDPTNRLRQQTRTVQLTATVTDARNQSASANAPVTVTLAPAASRRDIVFPNRSARVNNAAKRYLIEELTPQLRADPNSTVILIGHRDMSETGRAAATLDTQRVNNAAAVLSAGTGVCPALDLSRVQVKSDGTNQADPPQPFGDASVRERTGQTATDQRAQFRRVEVWFVPGGADAPPVTGLMPAPAAAIKRLGCPR